MANEGLYNADGSLTYDGQSFLRWTESFVPGKTRIPSEYVRPSNAPAYVAPRTAEQIRQRLVSLGKEPFPARRAYDAKSFTSGQRVNYHRAKMEYEDPERRKFILDTEQWARGQRWYVNMVLADHLIRTLPDAEFPDLYAGTEDEESDDLCATMQWLFDQNVFRQNQIRGVSNGVSVFETDPVEEAYHRILRRRATPTEPIFASVRLLMAKINAATKDMQENRYNAWDIVDLHCGHHRQGLSDNLPESMPHDVNFTEEEHDQYFYPLPVNDDMPQLDEDDEDMDAEVDDSEGTDVRQPRARLLAIANHPTRRTLPGLRTRVVTHGPRVVLQGSTNEPPPRQILRGSRSRSPRALGPRDVSPGLKPRRKVIRTKVKRVFRSGAKASKVERGRSRVRRRRSRSDRRDSRSPVRRRRRDSRDSRRDSRSPVRPQGGRSDSRTRYDEIDAEWGVDAQGHVDLRDSRSQSPITDPDSRDSRPPSPPKIFPARDLSKELAEARQDRDAVCLSELFHNLDVHQMVHNVTPRDLLFMPDALRPGFEQDITFVGPRDSQHRKPSAANLGPDVKAIAFADPRDIRLTRQEIREKWAGRRPWLQNDKAAHPRHPSANKKGIVFNTDFDNHGRDLNEKPIMVVRRDSDLSGVNAIAFAPRQKVYCGSFPLMTHTNVVDSEHCCLKTYAYWDKFTGIRLFNPMTEILLVCLSHNVPTTGSSANSDTHAAKAGCYTNETVCIGIIFINRPVRLDSFSPNAGMMMCMASDPFRLAFPFINGSGPTWIAYWEAAIKKYESESDADASYIAPLVWEWLRHPCTRGSDSPKETKYHLHGAGVRFLQNKPRDKYLSLLKLDVDWETCFHNVKEIMRWSEESIHRGRYSPAKRDSWLDLLGRIRKSFSEIAPERTRSGFVCEYSAAEYNVQTSMPDPFPDQEEE